MPSARAELPTLAPGSLIATDFDGTLSPIVEDPAAARPIDGALEVLSQLAARGHEVAVVSGRPLSFLALQLPEDLTLVGLYGLEARRNGQLVEHPNAGVWREAIADVATAAQRRGPEGMQVESKGLSITLHYRTHPELADRVAAYAAEIAPTAGLEIRPARCSIELHPPIDVDKGTAILRLAAEAPGDVVYLGDDVGDLPAFDALDELAAAGRRVLRVVVDSDELAPTLRGRGDLVVDGPAGARDLLVELAS